MKDITSIKLPYLIAEIEYTHDSSSGIENSCNEVIKDSGFDLIKFQLHIVDVESSIYKPFRINFLYECRNRFDYWKRMEFSFDLLTGLKIWCDDLAIDFTLSPFSYETIEITRQISCKSHKLGSYENYRETKLTKSRKNL